MATNEYNIVISVTSGKAVSGANAINDALLQIDKSAKTINNSVNRLGDRIASEMNKATVATKKNKDAMEQSKKAAKNLKDEISVLGKAFGILASAFALQGLKKSIDTYTNIQNKIKALSSETTNYAYIQEELYQISQRSRTSLEGTAQLYSRLIIAQKQLGASTQELMEFTEGVGKALQISGTSAFTQRGVLLQLSQAIGTNVVRAEEFNSILEGGIRIAQAAADGIDEAGGSISKLRKLVIDGKLSSQDFFEAILSQIPKLEEEFAKTIPTIDQSLVMLDNSWTMFLGKLNETTGASKAIALALRDVSENMDAFVKSIATAGTTLAAFYVSAKGLKNILVAIATALTGGWGKAILAIGTALGAYSLLREDMEEEDRVLQAKIESLQKVNALIDENAILTEQSAKNSLKNAEAKLEELDAEYQSLVVKMELAKAELLFGYQEGGERWRLSKDGIKAAEQYNEIAEKVQLINDAIFTATENVAHFEKALKEARKASDADKDGKMEAKFKQRIKNLKLEYAQTRLNAGQQAIYNQLKKTGLEDNEIIINQGKVTGTTRFNDLAQKIIDIQSGINHTAVNDALNDQLEVMRNTEIQQEVINNLRKAGYDADSSLVNAEGQLTDSYAKQNKAMTEIVDKTLKLNDSQTKANKELRDELIEQSDVWNSYSDLVTGTLSSTEDAIIDFCKTGKFNFSDFAASVIEDFSRIIIRAQLAKLAMSMGFGSEGGGFFGLFANGGLVTGPGTGTSDSIPARLSNGEFVVNAKSAQRYRGVLEAINNNRFASGGSVGGGSYSSSPTVQIIDQRSNSSAPVQTSTATGPDGQKMIRVLIRDTVRQGLAQGQYDGSLKNSYGLRRVGYNR